MKCRLLLLAILTRTATASATNVYVAANGYTNLDKLPANQRKAWWHNPRTGKATAIGALDEKTRKEFTPPQVPTLQRLGVGPG